MNKNYLSQVVWLVVLTIGILLFMSTIQPININFTIKQIDILSDLRSHNTNQYDDSISVATDVLTDTASIAITAIDSTTHISDTTLLENNLLTAQQIAQVRRKEGDITLVEDYSAEQNGIDKLIDAIDNRNNIGRPVRVAFLGDSFIEADIFTQNVRQALQDTYGGCGVGYMPMHSDFPGFRRSITQSDKGWTTHNVIKDCQYDDTSLPLQLFIASDKGANTRYKGVNKLRHIDRWETSKVVFIARDTATLTLKTDSTLHTYDIVASDVAQCITLNEVTSSLEVRCNSNQLSIWGTWLDARQGIAIDNISMRGYSGTTFTQIPIGRMRELNNMIPHDMIVLQYGLNRMTTTITNYEAYTVQLIDAINRLKQAFPDTPILIMGIGDRCQNENGEMKTLPAVYGMRKAQRDAAIKTGCLFWDTCEAMKSLGGMPAFVENKWGNKDYTHINHAGGRPLADEFVKALNYALHNRNNHLSHPTDTTSYE